ncbi:hypothetical protein PILCRDRAFT_92408 [Piloderma croceum F 1598]|uniref:Uncharacterized protein n=1 Tax=Piloderma croceum (strain F 1598) TaxID=765440 RepID=A0A0C3EQE5_PILCF|nr:hypothetical protein PILCRDRAFT_92408 [Piloderma croceum F 1598]
METYSKETNDDGNPNEKPQQHMTYTETTAKDEDANRQHGGHDIRSRPETTPKKEENKPNLTSGHIHKRVPTTKNNKQSTTTHEAPAQATKTTATVATGSAHSTSPRQNRKRQEQRSIRDTGPPITCEHKQTHSNSNTYTTDSPKKTETKPPKPAKAIGEASGTPAAKTSAKKHSKTTRGARRTRPKDHRKSRKAKRKRNKKKRIQTTRQPILQPLPILTAANGEDDRNNKRQTKPATHTGFKDREQKRDQHTARAKI